MMPSNAADAPAMVVKKIANTEKIISELRSVNKLTRPSLTTSGCTPSVLSAGPSALRNSMPVPRIRGRCHHGLLAALLLRWMPKRRHPRAELFGTRTCTYFLSRRRGAPLAQGDPIMTKPSLPPETALIARYLAPLAQGFPGAYGLLDDVAVINPAPGSDLVVKTDARVGGSEFTPAEPADLVARKAVRVNLSDLASKGATPRAYLLDLVVPNTIDEAWIAAFAAGLAHDQAEYAIHLIGGDTSSTGGPITIAVTAFGEVPVGRVVRRGGAQAGDTIFVTGAIG